VLGHENHRSLRVRYSERAVLVAIVLGILVFASRDAMAEYDTGEEASAPPDPNKVWYSWQIALADMSAVGIFYGETHLPDTNIGSPGAISFIATGTAVYLLAGPAIHLLQGQPKKAEISLGMRLLGPVALGGTGALLGFLLDSATAGNSGWPGLLPFLGGSTGIIMGATGAAVTDWFVLAWKPRTPVPDSTRKNISVRWLPHVTVALDSRRQTVPILGIGGTF
jgi:hypothetical protein